MKVLVPPYRAPTANGTASRPRPQRRHGQRLLWIAIGLALLVAVAGFALRLRGVHKPIYVTTRAVRGDLLQTVTAEGTVNPQNLILVGTQVSGTIAELDVDYNSPVRPGQIMAKIDPTTFRDALEGARASETQTGR